jgi:ABC-2 type transport system ATP-binding protein
VTVPVLDIRDLVIKYGDVTAVDHLTLGIDGGEVVGVLGGNGAGKSSTLRALAGVNPPTSGHLVVAGHDLSTPAGAEAARQVLGYCPDVGGLIRQITVREHIGMALALHHRLDLWPHAMDLAERLDLLRVFERTTQGFSHGMSRRLSVLLAVLIAERALILDEPFDGVDPSGVQVTLDVIAEAAANGLAVVVSTHLLDLIVEASQRVVVMAGGHLIDSGPASQYEGKAGKERYAALLAQAAQPGTQVAA